MRFTLLILFIFLAHQGISQDSLRSAKKKPDSSRIQFLDEIVVTATRLPEQLLRSPVSIEKANEKYFNASASPSFFDAIQNLKGVQMITPSLGFRVINTRGFTNTTNVRFAQLVDGMDIQSPHIGAPVGNALGPTDLDIQSVEIIPGCAAVLYGMNTINGLADFITKDPFENTGLSILQKTGVNRIASKGNDAALFSETSLRYATVFNDRIAVKFNVAFSTGTDWVADDKTDLNPKANVTTGLTGEANPAKDPVNGYGNESSNRKTLSLGGKNYVVARTGYFEKEVADYSLRNIKADAGIFFRPSPGTLFNYTYRVAGINTVYQRSNRFRLEDYLLQQHGLKYSSRVIKAKAYLNMENTGNSYNLRSMAENMDRVVTTDDSWFKGYGERFNLATAGGQDPETAHKTARSFMDRNRPLPGTPEFDAAFEKLSGINNWDSGAALKVKANLLHAEFHTDISELLPASILKQHGIALLAGMDGRSYFIEPDGNYFINPVQGKGDKDLKYFRWGGFLSLDKKLLKEKISAGVVLRFDKNDYFDPTANFRFSLVYSPVTTHNFRLAYQNGYRYPGIFEAFSNVNSGGVKRVGGLKVMSSGIFESSWLKSSIDAFQAAVNKDINTAGLPKNEAIAKNSGLLKKNQYTYLDPEHISSLEFGYKGVFMNGRLFADGELYFNRYNSFIAQVEVSVPKTSNPDSIAYALYDRNSQGRYRMWTNSATNVTNWGFGLRLRYLLTDDLLLDANCSHALLKKKDANDGLEDGFNSPPWMVNFTLADEAIWKRFGAGITWRWQDTYYWQSFLVNGYVPAFSALDAQVNYSIPKIGCKVRVGATNLLNAYNVSFLGGPAVGGLYYTTFFFQVK